jgi:hypothetical protein
VIKDNFNSFCQHAKDLKEKEEQQQEAAEDEEKEVEPPTEWNETDSMKRLKDTNGKKGDEILYTLLSQVFDEEEKIVSNNLMNYIERLMKEKVFDSKGKGHPIS